MKESSLRSYVYYALCELCDASDNLDSILSHLDDDSSESLVMDIRNDVENAINKLHNLSI